MSPADTGDTLATGWLLLVVGLMCLPTASRRFEQWRDQVLARRVRTRR